MKNTRPAPDYILVRICDFSRDVNGNPTAKHFVYTCSAEGQELELMSSPGIRRRQVGYGDYTSGAIFEIYKHFPESARYVRTHKSGSRSEESIKVFFRRDDVSETVFKTASLPLTPKHLESLNLALDLAGQFLVGWRENIDQGTAADQDEDAYQKQKAAYLEACQVALCEPMDGI